MNPTTQDLKDELVSSAVNAGEFAATSGWAVYIGLEPKSPDTVITLYDTGSWREPNPTWLIDYPRVNVRIRGAVQGYAAAYSKAVDIRDALLGITAQTINSTYYSGIWVLSDVAFIAFDDNNRPIFTINFRIMREPASGEYRTAL